MGFPSVRSGGKCDSVAAEGVDEDAHDAFGEDEDDDGEDVVGDDNAGAWEMELAVDATADEEVEVCTNGNSVFPSFDSCEDVTQRIARRTRLLVCV